MKIHTVSISNFRGYKNPVSIDFSNLTVFVGRNDIGKSTILEALDLFFNDGKGTIKYEDSDITVASESKEYTIGVSFSDLPQNVVVDDSFQTNLADEYLLNGEGELEIIKKYTGKKCVAVFVRANHPTHECCSNLHQKKKADLKKVIQENSINCENLNVNSIMRRAIWAHYKDNLSLAVSNLDITDGEDTKKIWAKLSTYLPVYSLFQSDRQNSDKDSEVQDPLKLAVSQFFQDERLKATLNDVALQVEQRLREVADRTLGKIREMDPTVANSLRPVIPSSIDLKWAKVFDGVSLTADDGIPINKRGSGVKRLVLLNFFRAEAERRQEAGDGTGIIYAIEEPETSQHFANQKVLADALIQLSTAPNTQIIMTTHSGVIVKQLRYSNLRMVSEDENGNKVISPVHAGLLAYPSMNEVNYTAFGEVTEEYHDELFGYIFSQGWLNDYENGKPQRAYIRLKQDGTLRNETRTLTHYIRDVQHHPENTNNTKYTDVELAQSINEMRQYIESKLATAIIY